MSISKTAFRAQCISKLVVKLNRIQGLNINYSKTLKGHTGIRFFIKDTLPILKYHNDEFTFNSTINDNNAQLTIMNKDNTSDTFEIQDQTAEEIFTTIIDYDGTTK